MNPTFPLTWRRCPKVAPLHDLFEARVRETPDAEAVVAGEERLTYRELNARANRLAHALRQKGVQRNDIVGLAVERNADIAIGILAILKAGAAYLPLDPDYPRRTASPSSSATPRLASCSSAAMSQHPCSWKPPSASTSPPQATASPTPIPMPQPPPMTSPTSSTPQGPPASQRASSSLTPTSRASSAQPIHGSPSARTTPGPSFTPTPSTSPSGSCGARSFMEAASSSSPTGSAGIPPRSASCSSTSASPSSTRRPPLSASSIQADLDEAPAPYALREIIFGGEALELQSLKPWIERYGDARPRLVNMYGITETTVHVTYRPITRADVEAGRGSVIGRPIPDLYIRLLDERGEPVPVGVPGEIWVGGAGVANGYLNRPELTAQRFVTDPFDPSRSARLYRAGDLARRLPDGDLEFLGRIDAQVKIRGFRIELGEIEAALDAHPMVRESVVITREAGPGDVRIVAYIVVGSGADLTVSEVRRYLRSSLPDHMIPSFIQTLQSIPLTANGKLDRGALPDVFRSVVDDVTSQRTAGTRD